MNCTRKIARVLSTVLASHLLMACSSVVVEDGSGASSSSAASPTGSGGSGMGGAPATSVTASSGSSATSTGSGESPPADEAVAYQINTGHTSAVENDTLTPPLTTRWPVNLGAVVSYPLIAGGRVPAA